MAFKMNGSPAKLGTISGTAGHRSALKQALTAAQQVNVAAGRDPNDYGSSETTTAKNPTQDFLSTFASPSGETTKSTTKSTTKKDDTETKQTTSKKTTKKKQPKVWIKKGGSMKHKMKDLKHGSKERYEEYERRGWKHDATTKGYKPTTTSTISTADVKSGSTADKKGKTKIDKMNRKYSEVQENRKVEDARRSADYAKEYFGKGSAEHVTAKYEAAKAKGEDLAGAGGGKRAWFFGNLRRKWNLAKQDKLRGKSERLSQEKHDAEDKAIAEYNLKKKQEKTS